jgi:hypothetical protein
MKATLTQKLNIIKSNKTFINYTLDNEGKLKTYVLNDDFIRYKNRFQTFKLLDLFKREYILNDSANFTINEILKHLNIK